jgi:hypothetical protein
MGDMIYSEHHKLIFEWGRPPHMCHLVGSVFVWDKFICTQYRYPPYQRSRNKYSCTILIVQQLKASLTHNQELYRPRDLSVVMA